jgi:hypothetical protein
MLVVEVTLFVVIMDDTRLATRIVPIDLVDHPRTAKWMHYSKAVRWKAAVAICAPSRCGHVGKRRRSVYEECVIIYEVTSFVRLLSSAL